MNYAKLLKVCNSKYILNYLAFGYSNKLLASANDAIYILILNIAFLAESNILFVYHKVR